jgi:hypothetical protein
MRMTLYSLARAALTAAVLFAALAGGAEGLSQEPTPPPPQEQTPQEPAPPPQEQTPQEPATQPQEPAQTYYKPTGEEGMIQGVITVAGNVPQRVPISTEADAVCASMNKGGALVDDLVVERGRLANALIYVESAALDSQPFAPRPWTPALGSRKCRTVPHVLAMQAGQTLYVQNNDQTNHNYRFQTKVNPLFNRALPPGGSLEILFKEIEPPFFVTCRQHPWEHGHVAVMPHPFFAVTRGNGSFYIEGLPPGDYEVVVWHERFKEARAKVSVGARETKDSNFTLKFPGDLR